MKIENMPLTQIDWTSIEAVEHTGTTPDMQLGRQLILVK